MDTHIPKGLVALLAVLGSAVAQDTSRLKIHVPKSLRKDGGYDHREALFGVPPYGGSIQQKVYYADQSMCDEFEVDTSLGYPLRSPAADGDSPGWPTPFILMIDRGGCTFVKKVRSAQKIGAAGVIIADNKCLCSAGDDCVPDDGDDEACVENEPIMADDGSGGDISIPSFLMFKQDADKIKEVLKQGTMVHMEMIWALPTANRKVRYDLYTTPTDKISRSFQDEFKEAAVALQDHASFTPHQYIYDGQVAGCQSFDGENMCYTLCTNSGRYCATDPDDDLDSGISGADVVRESLRRACIWDLYGSDGIGEIYWTYVQEFNYRCNVDEHPDYFFQDTCVSDAYMHSGVEEVDVARCMMDAGGLEGNVENSLLETQIAQRDAAGVVIVPSLYVNSAVVRGSLTFSTIFKAVCAGIESDHEPDVCKMCANCLDELSCVREKKCTRGQIGGVTEGVTVGVFLFCVAFMSFCFGCCGILLHIRTRSQMQVQVKSVMAEYMPLDKRSANVDTSVGIMS